MAPVHGIRIRQSAWVDAAGGGARMSSPNPRILILLFLTVLTAPMLKAGTSNRDFCTELKNFTSFECPAGMVCTRGLSDFQSHFSIFDASDGSGLGPEHFQLHYNRYPTIGSSRLLNLLILDAKSGEVVFKGQGKPSAENRQLISYPNGYQEIIKSGGLLGESRTFFVGLDTAVVWFRYRNVGSASRTIRPVLVGQFGDLAPPVTHSKPGGSKPGPNPLPPFAPGKLGSGTNVWFDQSRSTLMATRYMDLPRADSGRLMFAMKLPGGWKA